MRKATKLDRDKVVDIIAESFEKNPSVNWAIKQDKKRSKRLRVLAQYAFDTIYRRGGVYISSDEEGAIFFYKESEYKEGFADYIDQVKMAFGAVGLARVPLILKMEAYKKKIRPQNRKFIYCWFYGVKVQARGKGAAYEMKNALAEIADREQLPVYMETSDRRNIIAYKRWGYEIYHKWNVEGEDKVLSFMKREPKSMNE